jgi:C4-dicarboxylate-specific signal transduction histidine kinase
MHASRWRSSTGSSDRSRISFDLRATRTWCWRRRKWPTRAIDAEGPVRGDAEKLRRVVINLVQNALDALEGSHTASPSIEVSTGENLAATEVWLRVRDNGPGIDAAQIDRIFTPFHTTKESGTGLGLAISRKIVEAHGGTLEARAAAADGRGAELVVVLPKAGR